MIDDEAGNMSDDSLTDSLTLTEQVVLLGVASVEKADETPIQTHELRQRSIDRATEIDAEMVGTLSEADVMRSLYRLEDEGLVEQEAIDQASPTGKGRPSYSLATEVETVYDGVDGRLLDQLEEIQA